MKKFFYSLFVIILILFSCTACVKDNYQLNDIKEYKKINEFLDKIDYLEIYYNNGELDITFIIDNDDEINRIKDILKYQFFYKDNCQIVLGWQTKIIIITLEHLSIPIQINSIQENNDWYHPIDDALMSILEEYSIKYS